MLKNFQTNFEMATITLGIRKSKPNADGSFGIKIIIGSMGSTAYISTRYKIDNLKQWKDGRVIRHPDADYINKQLKKLLWEYEAIYDEMPNTDATAAEIRQYLLSNYRKSDFLKDHAEQYIVRLEKEGRKSYAQNMGYTLRYVLASNI